jgi:uncharacterized membrane protein
MTTEPTATPTPLELRQAEVDQYTANIAMYQSMLASLPTEYPEHLAQFKGVKNKHEVIAQIEDLNDVELLSKLWAADDCKAAIRAEMVERSKAQAILDVLKAQA